MTQEQITRMFENHSEEEVSKVFTFLNNKAAEEAAIAAGETPDKMVKGYLDKIATLDPQLAEVYPDNPNGKTIEDCLMYIENEAQEKCKNRSGFQCVTITSFDVFNWATMYFLNPEIKKIEKPKPAPIKVTTSVSNTPVKLDLEALLKEKEEWEIAHNERIDKWEKENQKSIEKFERENPMDLWGNKPENPFKDKVNPFANEQFPKQSMLDKALEQQDKTRTNEQTTEDASEPEPDPEAVGEIE